MKERSEWCGDWVCVELTGGPVLVAIEGSASAVSDRSSPKKIHQKKSAISGKMQRRVSYAVELQDLHISERKKRDGSRMVISCMHHLCWNELSPNCEQQLECTCYPDNDTSD